MLKAKRNGMHIASYYHETDPKKDFSSKLYSVHRKLYKGEGHLVVLGGHISESSCFDIRVPRVPEAELHQLIHFELNHSMPLPVGTSHWSYRIINDPSSEADSKYLVRIFVVHTPVFDEIVADIGASGIDADAVLCPYMIADPLYRVDNFYLPTIDNEYSFDFVGSGNEREMKPVAFDGGSPRVKELVEARYAKSGVNDLPHFIPAIISAEYALSREFNSDRGSMLELPEELKPHRMTLLKSFTGLMLTIAVLCIAGYAGRNYYEAFTTNIQIDFEKSVIEEERAGQAKIVQKYQHLDQMIKQIEDADAGNYEVASTLSYVSRKLPSYMWISNFYLDGHKIDLVIKTENDETGAINNLNTRGKFRVENIKKNRNNDGSVSIPLSLIKLDTSNLGGLE